MLPKFSRDYLLAALDNSPVTLSALLNQLTLDVVRWDARPDPERFNLREIVAHLADWEEVFRDRFERTVNEDHPHLLRPALDDRAIEKGYADANPQASLRSFQFRRKQLTDWLRTIPEDAWLKVGNLDRIGDISVEGLAAVALAHDSYHLRQVAEWLAKASL